MKPARGSHRASSKAPNKKKTSKTAEVTSNKDQEQSENATLHQKPQKKRKAEGGLPTVPQKMKGQDKWKVIPCSTVSAMENVIDLSILATLALKRTEKKESLEHLNRIKNRFLAHCTQIKAPILKQKNLVHSTRQHQEETRKSAVGRKSLKSLEEDLKAVVSEVERMEEQTASLQQTCSLLRDELEEEEEKAKQILKLSDRAVLKLPPVPQHEEETTLESRLRKIIPESEHETTARKLGEVLRKPKATQEAQCFLSTGKTHHEGISDGDPAFSMPEYKQQLAL